MPRQINPRSIPGTGSRYAQGIVHSARARRLVISGQVGLKMDGSVPEDIGEQMEAAWDNLTAVLTEAGMAVHDLISIRVFLTRADALGVYRAIRDRRLGGHMVTATYLEVAGLADPRYQFEIEAEAVCEEGDGVFLELPQADNAFAGLPVDPARGSASGT